MPYIAEKIKDRFKLASDLLNYGFDNFTSTTIFDEEDLNDVKVKIKVYTGKKAKTYAAKSNAKGIAKLLTKKLKVGKHKVIVTSANKYCVAKKAKSTIKITK